MDMDIDQLRSKVSSLETLNRKLILHNQTLQRELGIAYGNNNQRNVELSALHYVFCSGGCDKGVHRYGSEGPEQITPEVLEAAVRNTVRLVEWASGYGSRTSYTGFREVLRTIARPLKGLRQTLLILALKKELNYHRRLSGKRDVVKELTNGSK